MSWKSQHRWVITSYCHPHVGDTVDEALWRKWFSRDFAEPRTSKSSKDSLVCIVTSHIFLVSINPFLKIELQAEEILATLGASQQRAFLPNHFYTEIILNRKSVTTMSRYWEPSIFDQFSVNRWPHAPRVCESAHWELYCTEEPHKYAIFVVFKPKKNTMVYQFTVFRLCHRNTSCARFCVR